MHHLVCAECQDEGKSACKNCLLVLYCSAECQKKHWPLHKQDCKSPLIKDTWQPSWQAEGRDPHFIGNGPPLVGFGAKKYLWGNVPAIDVVKLEANEGPEYEGDLSFLFAASEDPRNIFKTFASSPQDCSSKVSATVNDIDFDIVARNAVILLTAFCLNDVEQAVDCMLHVWYSAMLTQQHVDVLRGPVRKLVEEPSAGAVQEAVVEATAVFEVPNGLTCERAVEIRQAVTLAHDRRDYRDRAMFLKSGPHRLCATRFREDGILLLFGCSRDSFNIPNPTMFQTDDWPMMDSSDPIEGWDFAAILSTSTGPTANDVYGKMYTHVPSMLRAFCDRVKSLPTHVTLLNVDAKDLHAQVEDGKFARVEISNICDMWCLGPAGAVGHLSRFLQSHNTNPHATMITLFMNAIPEEMTQQEVKQDMQREMGKVMKYLPLRTMPQSMSDPRMLMCMEARTLFRDNDKYFDRYIKTHKFTEIERHFGVAMKGRHTIIDEWPQRLKKKAGEKGDEEEFKTLLASGRTGTQRYVEWKRTT